MQSILRISTRASCTETISTAAKQPLLERMAEPDEIARAAWFLSSSESGAITGATLTVDGGWSIS